MAGDWVRPDLSSAAAWKTVVVSPMPQSRTQAEDPARARKVRFQLRRCSDSIVISTSRQTTTRISAAGGAIEVCRR